LCDKFIKYISRTNSTEKLLKEFTIINNIIKNELKRRYIDLDLLREMSLDLLREMSHKLAIVSDKIIKDKTESDDNGT
jgi:hypothetical protein